MQDSCPQIFALHDSSHDLPPHERLSRAQASYSEQPGLPLATHLATTFPVYPTVTARLYGSGYVGAGSWVFTEQASASAQPASGAGEIPPHVNSSAVFMAGNCHIKTSALWCLVPGNPALSSFPCRCYWCILCLSSMAEHLALFGGIFWPCTSGSRRGHREHHLGLCLSCPS